jgi:hypothetical protein
MNDSNEQLKHIKVFQMQVFLLQEL